MVNLSTHPYVVDGVRLDTLAYGVEAALRRTGALRPGDLAVAGLDGVIPSLNDPREPGVLTLTMIVRGTDADGLVPSVGAPTALIRNLDDLRALFGRTDGLLDVRETVDPNGQRRNLADNPALDVDLTGWMTNDSTKYPISRTSVAGNPSFPGKPWAATTVRGGTLDNVVASIYLQGRGGLQSIKVTPGQRVSVALRAYTNGAGRGLQVGVAFRNSAGAVIGSTQYGNRVGLSGWTLGKVEGLTAPTGTDSLVVAILITTLDASAALNGEQVWYGTALIEDQATLSAPTYWDGDLSADPAMAVEWTGTPGASASRTVASERQALCKVLDAMEPEVVAGNSGRFTVSLTIPGAYMQDAATADWSRTGIVSGTAYEVPTLQGATGPADANVALLTGPADSGVTITDPNSGQWVRLNRALAAGETWRLNAATWETRTGTAGSPLGLGSLDTTGTDAAGQTDTSGTTPRLLRLTPRLDNGARRVKVQVTGTGFTAATSLAMRTRRKWA